MPEINNSIFVTKEPTPIIQTVDGKKIKILNIIIGYEFSNYKEHVDYLKSNIELKNKEPLTKDEASLLLKYYTLYMSIVNKTTSGITKIMDKDIYEINLLKTDVFNFNKELILDNSSLMIMSPENIRIQTHIQYSEKRL